MEPVKTRDEEEQSTESSGTELLLSDYTVFRYKATLNSLAVLLVDQVAVTGFEGFPLSAGGVRMTVFILELFS